MPWAFTGYLHDIARGAYLKPSVFRAAIRHAAACGFTHYVPYLENMIRLTPIAKACPACAYTAADWRTFDDTAATAGIELVPHFNVIGHQAQICRAYPQFSSPDGTPASGDGRETEADPTTAVTRAMIRDSLTEYCAFSRSRYFLIGGDEWNPPHHLLERTGFDAGHAWVETINFAVALLADRGRIPIVWHDMLSHYPSTLDQLSRAAVIAFWKYDVDSDYPALRMFKQRGFKVIMASGMCNGALTGRRLAALHCALQAGREHAVDGLLMTSWFDGRWERQKLNIEMVGHVLHGTDPDPEQIEAISLHETLKKAPPETPYANRLRRRTLDLLDGPAWRTQPEYREFLAARLANDPAREMALYARSQALEGPIVEAIRTRIADAGTPPGSAAASATPVAVTPPADGFGLTTRDHETTGPAIRFHNYAETFVVYPKFGAVLQDWRRGSRPVIPHHLPRFLRDNPRALPGAYRGYKSPGLRPVWALGAHDNPCILWQYPWSHRILENGPESCILETALSLPHVSVSARIAIRRGHTGFTYALRAENHLAEACCAWNWNLYLAIEPSDLARPLLHWTRANAPQSLTISRQDQDGFWIEARDRLHVTPAAWTLDMAVPANPSAGYFVDWGTHWITPDLRGRYHPMSPGDTLETTWVFRLGPPRTDGGSG